MSGSFHVGAASVDVTSTEEDGRMGEDETEGAQEAQSSRYNDALCNEVRRSLHWDSSDHCAFLQACR